jgi:hypothetical protein
MLRGMLVSLLVYCFGIAILSGVLYAAACACCLALYGRSILRFVAVLSLTDDTRHVHAFVYSAVVCTAGLCY